MRIVFTGPESSGKTSLANFISNQYKGKLIPEYSRQFLNENGPHYTKFEITQMAISQHTMAISCHSNANLQIEDGDLLTYIVWQQVKFGGINEYLLELWLSNAPDIYFICFPDLPWFYDPLREHPKQREMLFKLYLTTISKYGFKYQIITGIGQSRLSNVNYYIQSLLRFRNFVK